jgi:hypothetical protein
MRPHGPALWFCLLLGACGAPSEAPSPGAGPVIYLNFSDGTEGIEKASSDDAAGNRSTLCETGRLPRWNGAAGCGGRERCRDEIVSRVREHFRRYAARITTTRPPDGVDYTMLVVMPPNLACSFGQRGLAPLDCGDQQRRNLGFVSDCRDPAVCAVVISHELGHTFGLVHSQNPNEIMYSNPAVPTLTFRDEDSATASDGCDLGSQNAHRTLLATLGAAP